jgi:hypothetical protein
VGLKAGGQSGVRVSPRQLPLLQRLAGNGGKACAGTDRARSRSAGHQQAPARPLALPAPIIPETDSSGHSQIAFLGLEAFGSNGSAHASVFVTDRFGEIGERWAGYASAELPPPAEILAALWQIQIACEECGLPHWPLEG